MQSSSRYKRIMIIGCSGSGKTTLAEKLSKDLKLPHINLDQHFFKPNWVETPILEWHNISNALADDSSWVMDGTYSSTLDYRISRADTIIYLDVGTIKCLTRVVRRTLKYHGEQRPHMAEGCRERFDLDFLHYVAVYNLTRRKKFLDKIAGVSEHKYVFVLTSKAAQDFKLP